jgi:release factor glutamine methyltransferase
MNIFSAIQQAENFLKEHQIEYSQKEIRDLLAKAIDKNYSYTIIHQNEILTPEQKSIFFDWIYKRREGYPTAYILGEVGFYKSLFKVKPGVLIPRPETELLVEKAVAELESLKSPRFIDFGCGSGCIGLSLLRDIKSSSGLMIDISEIAIEITESNAENLGVKERLELLHSDIKTCIDKAKSKGFENSDLVVSNPPYIGHEDPLLNKFVKKYEPALAFFGGARGWELYEVWFESARKLLKANGLLIFEIGHDQGEVLEKIIAKNSLWGDIKIQKDLLGRNRFITARKLR